MPEERRLYVGDIISDADPRVVLCSLQYTEEARSSIQFLVANGFRIYIQWLNPGFSDDFTVADLLWFVPFLLHHGAVFSIRIGRDAPNARVREIREYLIGWASTRHVG